MSPDPPSVDQADRPLFPTDVPAAPADEQRLCELGRPREPAGSMSGRSDLADSCPVAPVRSGRPTCCGPRRNAGGPTMITWGLHRRRRFTGPKVQGPPEESVAAEAEPEVR